MIPGKSNTRLTKYTDLVAYVWTTYWNVQLNLANLICRLNSALSESISESTSKREAEKFRQEVETYIDDISASIPFMLAGDSIRYCEPTGTSWHLHKPPMLLGGLSMQWVLFNVATLGSAPAASKRHARDILSWFGDVLGIGQSKVLAQVYKLSNRLFWSLADLYRCMRTLASPLKVTHFDGAGFFCSLEDHDIARQRSSHTDGGRNSYR